MLRVSPDRFNDNKLGEALFAKVGAVLRQWFPGSRPEPSWDATIIGALSSTKNADRHETLRCINRPGGQAVVFRDEAAHRVDSQDRLAHSATVTAVTVHDKHLLPDGSMYK